MGNSGLNSDKQVIKLTPINTAQTALKKLNKITVIGRGGFGKVWKVEVKKTHKLYAMKEMSKAKILMKKSVESVLNQLQLLKCLKHEFLINAVLAFQDRQNLYMVMDLLSGGDLRFHLIKQGRFNQQQTKFFACCIIVALQFLHINGILHRDIKPENLVFDKKGYLRLTDLGVARIWKPENSADTSGTPGYMAPQVMCRCNHGIAIDYYALGVIVFECMFGIRPYIGQTRQQIRDKILSKQASVKKNEVPFGWSQQAADFVNQTIQRKPQARLGNNGPQEIMAHPWFKNIDWEKLKSKKLQSPFAPVYRPQQYQDQLSAIQDQPIPPQTLLLMRKQAIQNLFIQYYYDGEVIQNPLLENLIH